MNKKGSMGENRFLDKEQERRKEECEKGEERM